jgi:LysM repeat protein
MIRIAEAYGVSVNDLAALNGLIDINRIREGDVLVIPQPAPGE